MTIIVLPEAADEFKDATAYYGGKQSGLGQKLRDEVDYYIRWIAEHAEIPRLRPGGYRRVNLRVFPHYIAYMQFGETISILAIAHAHREPKYWIDRKQHLSKPDVPSNGGPPASPPSRQPEQFFACAVLSPCLPALFSGPRRPSPCGLATGRNGQGRMRRTWFRWKKDCPSPLYQGIRRRTGPLTWPRLAMSGGGSGSAMPFTPHLRSPEGRSSWALWSRRTASWFAWTRPQESGFGNGWRRRRNSRMTLTASISGSMKSRRRWACARRRRSMEAGSISSASALRWYVWTSTPWPARNPAGTRQLGFRHAGEGGRVSLRRGQRVAAH